MLNLLKQRWWKVIAVVLMLYTLVAGMLASVPALPILNESIRNLYFHVPMWFGMLLMLLYSVGTSIAFLSTNKTEHDIYARESALVGLLFGTLGLLTGMLWARVTWGAWFPPDPKMFGSVAGLLIYVAYFVLRGSLDDEFKRAKVSAVYSIFSYTLFIVFIFIIPRMTDSLHPGSGGNPGFNVYDLDSRMRMVFYPAVLGWTMLGFWLVSLRVRYQLLFQHSQNNL